MSSLKTITGDPLEGPALVVEQNANPSLEAAQYAYVLEVGRITLEGEASKLIDDPHVKKAYLGR